MYNMDETFGDRIVAFYEKYIKVSEKKISKKEEKLLEVDDYNPVLRPRGYEKLSPEKRRKIALMSPILMKGIKKKSMDTFRAWFTLETEDGKTAPVKADIDAFKEFEKRSQIKKKLLQARICAHIYGDGYLLISFTNDEKKGLNSPVDVSSEPYNVLVLNPEFINEMRSINGQLYYSYKDATAMEEKLIHPDRIMHFMIDKLPHSNFGISTIDILRWTLESQQNVDKASGEILSWFSHGILDLAKEGLSDPERDNFLKIAAKHPGAWVHDTDVEIDYKNPSAIDPKPFYDYIILNIAAVLNMPTHVLTGIQTGRVTGSEIGFSDYYRDVRDEQQLIFEPEIEKLYSRILAAKGRRWKYIFKWNEIYVDEGMEVEQLVKKIQAAEIALNGTRGAGGFITKEEARKILNDGQILVDPENTSGLKDAIQIDIEKERKTNEPKKPPQKPDDEREPKRPTLSEEEYEMIQRCREAKKKALKELAEKEKALGEEILKEQDDTNDSANTD
jgi:hypothetical protein